MIESDVRKERQSFYYVLAVSLAVLAVVAYLFSQTDQTLPVQFLVFASVAYFVFTLLNAEAVMGLRNALWLKAVVGVVTLGAEALGVNYGLVFGSYAYSSALGVKVLGVPLLVVLVWDIFIYSSYMLVTHALDYRFTEDTPLSVKAYLSAITAVLVGLATVAIDFVVDPLAIHYGWWEWTFGGAYFPSLLGGVPVTNFLGWVFVTALAIFLFKFFVEEPYEERETVYEYASIAPYLTTLVALAIIAPAVGLAGPALVGVSAMSAFVLFFLAVQAVRSGDLPGELVGR